MTFLFLYVKEVLKCYNSKTMHCTLTGISLAKLELEEGSDAQV